MLNFQPFVADALSVYLGYSDFAEFTLKERNSETKKTGSIKLDKKLIALAIAVTTIIIAVLVYKSVNTQRWMVWQNNQYVEVSFDAKLLEKGKLKLYKEDRIEKFKKVQPTCDYPFFDEVGNVKIWYGKNRNKNYEFFTGLGLHPETGKTLKPITTYMIEKYICD
jgi:hypothetical protein